MLSLIGLGLDQNDISLKGVEAIRAADTVYVEFYTNTAMDVTYSSGGNVSASRSVRSMPTPAHRSV